VKKVLIISYFFPPRPGVASLRLGGLAKYLPEFGWEPTIITAKLPSHSDPRFHVIETKDSDILIEWKRRLGFSTDKTFREQLGQSEKKDTVIDFFLNCAKEILAYPDYNKGWYKYAMPVARELLENKKYNAIISSAGPYTSHIIAHDLKKHYNIRWIADFRDLWTQNPYFSYSRIRNFFEKKLEMNTLSMADAITTISQPLANDLQFLHKSPICVIPNGFDPNLLTRDISLTKKFTITYTGRLYRGKRDPEPLFRTLQKLINDKKIDSADVEIHFWGSFERWIRELVTHYHLDTIVRFHDPVPNKKSVEKQQGSQILLLLSWNNPREEGVLTGKLFEYLAARRPILSLGYSKGALSMLLDETHAGFSVENDREIEDAFLKFYAEFKNTGQVHYKGIDSEVQQYSHLEMARKFAKLLDQIVPDDKMESGLNQLR
jgi:glycosyltransferase involved in cell wall biosynthesis